MTVTITSFRLPATPPLIELRQVIWQGLFSLYKSGYYQSEVLNILHTYCTSGMYVDVKEIIEEDAKEVISFIASEFDPEQYVHCLVAQDYFHFLDKHGAQFSIELKERFRNGAYDLSELLFDDWAEIKDLGWEEYQEQKRQQIKTHFAKFDFSQYQLFFRQCAEIKANSGLNREQFHFDDRVAQALLSSSDENATLFIEVLEQYFQDGNFLGICHYGLVFKLIEICGSEQAYEILLRGDYSLKRRWLFVFFEVLPSYSVNLRQLEQLYELYREAQLGDLPSSFDYLLKYLPLDADVLVHTTEAIVSKTRQDRWYGQHLTNLFNPYSEACKRLRELFVSNVDVLKRAYLATCDVKSNLDYNGGAFSSIIDLDRNFAREYIEWMYARQDWLSRYDDTRHYHLLWKRDDYKEVLMGAFETIYEHEKERFSLHSYLDVFFAKETDKKSDEDVEKRKLQFLEDLIAHRHTDRGIMEFVFSVISSLPSEQRKRSIAIYLIHNLNFEDFSRLPLEPNDWSWVGSEVSLLQKRVWFFESIIPLFNSVELLRHKQYVERVIMGLRDEIEQEKKKDFANE